MQTDDIRRELFNADLVDHDRSNEYSNFKNCLFQGHYVRWDLDNSNGYNAQGIALDATANYKKMYIYQSDITTDKNIGSPQDSAAEVCFKANMHTIPGGYAFDRSEIQIHPDGWRDGTGGCIGLQDMEDIRKMKKYLQKLHGLKIRVKSQDQ